MRRLFLFMMVTLDGYFEGENHDLSWHNVNSDFNDNFIVPQTKKVETILFGRRTFDMMAEYWPSEEARKSDPITSKLMGEKQKFVFSKTLKKAVWQNTTLVSKNANEQVKRLKSQKGGDIAIFGSNNLMVGLSEKGLVDEFRIIINPIAIGHGTPLFKGLTKKINLKLIKSEGFKNGNILAIYKSKTKSR